MHARIAKLAITQPADRIIFIQALLRLGGGFDVPFNQRIAECLGDFLREHRLARAWLTLDQQRAFQRHRGIHRNLQLSGCDVSFSAFELRHALLRLSGLMVGRATLARKPPNYSAGVRRKTAPSARGAPGGATRTSAATSAPSASMIARR